MRVRFWGVRGSLPAPLLPAQIKSKISSVLARVTPDDLISPESREHFLAGLPPWLFGTVGGNTPCVSAHSAKELLVFDCGSGIRELGLVHAAETPKPQRYHIFFSHFHWDHLQGLPFFSPAYDPSVTLNFYSPTANLESTLSGQMTAPYFPVQMETMGSAKKFHHMKGRLNLETLSIDYKKMKHPGDSYSYIVREGNKRFIYATDTELDTADFIKTEENVKYFQNADLIVLDSQYTLDEAIDKNNWGHNAFSMAVDFAANWGIKQMVLFHHDPAYNDHKLYTILQSARWYMERMNIKGITLTLAQEGLEIEI